MKIIKTRKELVAILSESGTLKRGFVPTMGALHKGHASLLELARQNNQLLISSLFVNPTQFNNPEDLKLYPRPLDEDIAILQSYGVDIAFIPNTEEIYQNNIPWHLELGKLDQILEGASRPGHFQGVTQVVKILFDLVHPQTAYFGLKDYQQFLVISKMVQFFNLPIQLVACPIIREEDGLAMSSRNLRLSQNERIQASLLFRILNAIRQMGKKMSPEELTQWAVESFNNQSEVVLEYFAIVNSKNLKPILNWADEKNVIALVAARVGGIRLIDNMVLSQE